MKRKERSVSDVLAVLSRRGEIYMPVEFARNEIIFAQGDPADAVFQIRRGKVKLTVSSQAGKEAVISLLGAGDYFGEACLAGQPIRLATARALADCSVVRLPKAHMTHLLREDRTFSEEFLSYALGRIIRIEEDLIDQLFNSSEKRLARLLLLLANFGTTSAGATLVLERPRTRHPQSQSGDPGRNDWNDSFPRQLLHEPLSEIGLYRVCRRHQGAFLVAQRFAERLTRP